MAILSSADIPTIRDRLGDMADDLTDAELLASVIVRPVEAAILRAYPDIDQTATDTRLAASLMVAAAHLRDVPEATQSRLGQSSITVKAGESERIAASWETTAWSLLTPTTEDDAPIGGAFLFGRIAGRR